MKKIVDLSDSNETINVSIRMDRSTVDKIDERVNKARYEKKKHAPQNRSQWIMRAIMHALEEE